MEVVIYTFVFWVVDHGWLPFAVHFLVPIFRHGSIWVGNVLWLLPVIGLGVVWVGNLFSLVPLYLIFEIMEDNELVLPS